MHSPCPYLFGSQDNEIILRFAENKINVNIPHIGLHIHLRQCTPPPSPFSRHTQTHATQGIKNNVWSLFFKSININPKLKYCNDLIIQFLLYLAPFVSNGKSNWLMIIQLASTLVGSVKVNFLSYRYRADKSTIFGMRGLWGLTINSGRGATLKYL